MPILTPFKKLENKYAITFASFILAIIFGSLALYSTFIQDRGPALRVKVASQTKVYDIREDVGKLDILFNGVNIREKKQMLSVITLSVFNTGASSILNSYYDDRDPLGVRITDAQILKAELASASTDYLKRTVIPKLLSPSEIIFSPVILDEGSGFSVRILIIHSESITPKVNPIGKVAFVRQIELIQADEPTRKAPFWQQLLSGGFLVQLARGVIYSICTILVVLLVVILVVIPISSLQEKMETRKRRRRVNDYKSLSKISFTPEDDFIFSSYIEYGEGHLRRMVAAISDKEKLADQIAKGKQPQYEYDERYIVMSPSSEDRDIYPIERMLYTTSRSIVKAGLVKLVDGEVIVNEHMNSTLMEFIRFLKSRSLIEKPDDNDQSVPQ
jgi:hypothetical protein